MTKLFRCIFNDRFDSRQVCHGRVYLGNEHTYVPTGHAVQRVSDDSPPPTLASCASCATRLGQCHPYTIIARRDLEISR